MTCRDKLRWEHPEAIDWRSAGGSAYCPHHFGYASKPEWCKVGREKCKTCWDREVGFYDVQGKVEAGASWKS